MGLPPLQCLGRVCPKLEPMIHDDKTPVDVATNVGIGKSNADWGITISRIKEKWKEERQT